MPQNRKVPRGVAIISILSLLGGILLSLISMSLFLLGSAMYTSEPPGGPQGILHGWVSIVCMDTGLIGVTLGVFTTLSGLGLRRMKRWGLWCSYLTMTLWVLANMFVVSLYGINLIAILICTAMIGIAVAISIYLNRAYQR
jgi:FtsH-binding integral membrane protein